MLARVCAPGATSNQEDPLSAHRSVPLLAVLLVALLGSSLLGACTPEAAQAPAVTSAPPPAPPTATSESAAAAAAPAPAESAATCPDADFDSFLARFSADIAVQETATADPLAQGAVDPDAQPEPRMVVKEVPLAEVEWPVIPNLKAARNGGREVVVSSEEGGGRQVLVRTPDTDDQQTYHFAQRPCWTLVRVLDELV